ncbi:glycoside hydrolase family 31 protein [Bacillus sp. ISL-47]|uniref:glycoside hydrolase family 31 protein n=1 Tax=Bacillus sp. ISL-47 TaxID=2819130 RepID=UPI001BECA86C|nr:glycoside hydrolase family 31 protein [Bacillus sp. ISL-47]MBT2688999.1 glycoside hydrolase family 31 protein [Bacillus sp. ISL-47]MBT2708722.1 glycoside hydrolase family 31 protein [Pseudomonas sp. ISL-84]
MLEDTSFAIHPDKENKISNTEFQDIGDFISYKREEKGVTILTESGEFKVLFYREDIVRFFINFFGDPQLGKSPAIISSPIDAEFFLDEQHDVLRISTAALNIAINKFPIRIKVSDSKGRLLVNESEKGMGYKRRTKEVICFKEMDERDHFYGFGEKTGFLNKRGEKLFMWNSDVYAPHNPETDPLYQSVPYFMTLRDGHAHGLFFNNTFKSTFDLRTEQTAYSFSAEGGQMDYFIMAGPAPKEVLEQYTYLTGRMPIPPKWAIGYHQSRYSYESEKEVRELANTFLEKAIPLDVIYLDIHYMDEYRVFTFDKNRFPNPQKLVQDLKDKGIRIVPIVDPGVKEDPEYYVYQEGIIEDHFCKYLEGNIYFGDVWPGNSAFPDFTDSKVRKWWGIKHKFYSDLGIEGIWNDMNEPAVFNDTKTMDNKVMHRNDGDPKTHRELHNLYGLYMGEATYTGMKEQLNGKRPFLLTRAGYSGVQRYAAVWTGDNRSFWEHLQMSLPMVMNLGLSGIPFSGPDVGGFAHDSNGELLARWTQVGALTPYFRNHSALGFLRQEPWSFGEKYEKIIKKYIELRYKWLPHLYNLFAEASQKGLPIMRPLMMEFPSDKNTYNISDQFMIGDNVICAPILQPSQTHRSIYLPKGRWVDYWTDEILEGDKYHLIEADLDTLPLFIKTGTFIVHGEVKQSTNIQDKKLVLHYYLEAGKHSDFSLYDDDGSSFKYEKGEFLLKTFHAVCSSKQISLKVNTSGKYKPDWSQIELMIYGAQEDLSLIVNGEEKTAQKRNGEIKSFVL